MKQLITASVMALILVGRTAWAQQELTLHFLEDIPQTTVTNPAFLVDKKWILSLPSFAFNYGNNAFSYHDLIRKNIRGSNFLDIDYVLNKLGNEDNILQNQLNVDLLRFQIKFGKVFLTTSLSENLSVKFNYDKDLIDFFWNGNAGYIGKTVQLDPDLRAVYFREIGIGAGYDFGSLKLGIRGNLLEGLADLTTTKGNALVYTNENDYAVTLYTDYLINTSEIPNFFEDPLANALSFKNLGMALDVGASFVLEKWKVNASLNNLGFINWKNNIINYSNTKVYTYDGLELDNYLKSGKISFKELLDTLDATFSPTKTEGAYQSRLVPQSYFSVFYYPNSNLKTGALVFSEWASALQPAYSFFVSNKFANFFSLGLSYSVKNKTYNNVGLSAVFNFKKFQIFAVSDNFVNTISPKSARNINFRWGINLQFYDPEEKNSD